MKKSVIQFKEGHKWCGCFGYIHDLKAPKYYVIAVPIPQEKIAFIYAEKKDFDIVGTTDLILGDEK